MKHTEYFFGAVSAKGFVSQFGGMYAPAEGWRTYIIKGGPGSGKSSLMKKVAKAAEKAGDALVLGPCSSDPDSLDVVLLPERKICIADGTAPHVLEPKFPGACETIINMGDCWDGDQLAEKAPEIIAAYQKNAAQHERVARYISAAGALLNDNYRLALECTDNAKAGCFATSVARREFGPASRRRGREQVRLLSAVTPKGHLLLEDTIHKACRRVYAVEDENCAASRLILSVLRGAALDSGLDIISCPCSIHPEDKIEHLLIPSLSLAFCTSNAFHPIANATRRIHARRFTDLSALGERKQKMQFNKRAVKELLSTACGILADAKASHDEMEAFYIDAMNFAKANKTAQALIKKLYP